MYAFPKEFIRAQFLDLNSELSFYSTGYQQRLMSTIYSSIYV